MTKKRKIQKSKCGKRPNVTTVRNPPRNPRPNSQCPCGSGKKYKKCHGRPVNTPQVSPRVSIYDTMRALYDEDQLQAEKAFIKQWGFVPNPSQLMTFMEGDAQETVDMVVQNIRKAGGGGRYVYAVEQTGFLLTSLNKDMYTEAQTDAYNDALEEFDRRGSNEHGHDGTADPDTDEVSGGAVQNEAAGRAG